MCIACESSFNLANGACQCNSSSVSNGTHCTPCLQIFGLGCSSCSQSSCLSCSSSFSLAGTICHCDPPYLALVSP